MARSRFDEEDMDGVEAPTSGLLAREDDKDVPFCGCLSVKYYQPFFDVETEDILARIRSSALYLKKDDSFMRIISDKPDAYGPFWIATSLIFVVAFTSHLSSWLSSWMHGKNWQYDFESVVTAASLIYGFAFGAPAALWLILRQYEPKVKLITIICLYGYSLFIFIPWTFVCLIPQYLYGILPWVTVLLTAVMSALFLARNLAPTVLEICGAQGTTVLASIGVAQLVFSIVLKVYFFSK